eukprot:3806977-Pyramimonas_sp.AAC.1
MVLGNLVADELAGVAALQHRVPEADRYRVQLHERRARLVRLRLLRATLDYFARDKQLESERRSTG